MIVNNDTYELIARDIRANPDSLKSVADRRWIVRYHIRNGGMPPLDLRPDYKRFQ